MSRSEEESTSCVGKNMKRATPISPLKYAKTIFQYSGKLKDEVILQTNDLIDILRQRQQQLCQEIDEKTLQHYDTAEKQPYDILFSFSGLNFHFQSNFEHSKALLNGYGKIVIMDETDEFVQSNEVSPETNTQSKAVIFMKNLLEDIKYRKSSPSRSHDNDSQASSDSFDVIDNNEKAELQKQEKEYLTDEDDDLEIISAEASEFTSGSESDFSPERCQKNSKLWWRNFKALERQFKQAVSIKSLVKEENPLASEVTNSVASTQLVNNQSHSETFPKGLFSQALEEANKNTTWLAECSDKSSEAKEIIVSEIPNAEETNSSSWLVSSKANNEARKKMSSQIPDMEEENKLSWLRKPSSKPYNETNASQTHFIEEMNLKSSPIMASWNEIPSLMPNIEKTKRNSSWLVESLKENNDVCRSPSSDVEKISDFRASVNKSRKPFEIVQFCFGTYLNDSPEEWLSPEASIKELHSQCKLSSNFPKPGFKNVFDEWLCSKDSIDTWLTPRK